MQQINLYLPEFRPNRQPFRFIHLLLALPVLLIFLAVVSVSTHIKAKKLQESVFQKEELVKQLSLQLQTIKASKPVENSQSIDVQIAELEQKLQKRKQILSLVTREDFGNMGGFSTYLNGFAEAGLPDIALGSFSLSAGGTYVEFSGDARSASAVPEYIKRLRDQSSFRNARMGVMSIQPSSNGVLAFSVSNPKKKKDDEKFLPEVAK